MTSTRLPQFPRVAVLGAGVMGAQIAARHDRPRRRRVPGRG